MLTIKYSSTFRKDVKRAVKRGKDINSLKAAIGLIASGEGLPTRFRDHALSGNLSGFRECHIEPDWLLVYQIHYESLVLALVRTGSHSDLF